MPKALESLKSALSGKDVVSFEIDQRDANGKIFTMEINGTAVRKGDKAIAVEGIMRDITDRKHVEEEARRSTEKLIKAMENTISGVLTMKRRCAILNSCR